MMDIVLAETARRISAAVGIPTIGIGSGRNCDGQILVTYDLVGMFPWFQPKFVSPRAQVAAAVRTAVTGFVEETRNGA